MAAVALKDLGLPMTNDGYRYYDQITFGLGSAPPRPEPGPTPPTEPPGPVDPDYGIPETGLPGWSKAALGPPPQGSVVPTDPPLAANYEWMIVVYADRTTAWAQVGPHAGPTKKKG